MAPINQLEVGERGRRAISSTLRLTHQLGSLLFSTILIIDAKSFVKSDLASKTRDLLSAEPFMCVNIEPLNSSQTERLTPVLA